MARRRIAAGCVGVLLLAGGAAAGGSAGVAAPLAQAPAIAGRWAGPGDTYTIAGRLNSGFTISLPTPGTWLCYKHGAGMQVAKVDYLGGSEYTLHSTVIASGPPCVANTDFMPAPVTVTLRDANTLVIDGCTHPLQACMTLTREGSPAPAKKTPPPSVRALGIARPIVKPGRLGLPYSGSSSGGNAAVHIALYDGGVPVSSRSASTGVTTGFSGSWPATIPADVRGPLYYCVWAENAAGQKSVRAPYSSCAWISVLVPIERVSNGCGGTQWGENAALLQNLFLDRQTFGTFTVDFSSACNIHDAGYAGATVEDGINGGEIDFRRTSRDSVDKRFLHDLQVLCAKAIKGQGAAVQEALGECLDGKRGARAYHDAVRLFAKAAFDDDLSLPEGVTGPPRLGGALRDAT